MHENRCLCVYFSHWYVNKWNLLFRRETIDDIKKVLEKFFLSNINREDELNVLSQLTDDMSIK
jgi:hypothetical protein